jgi:2-methylcitrate dehydratase PrpD
MTDYFLDRLARFCAGTTYEMLPPGVIHQAKRCVLDLLGCALGAVALGCNQGVVQHARRLGGRAEAHVWGTDVRVPASHAALANGTTAHHLDMDDGHAAASSHPGISVIPAALAAAEATGASGRDLLLAVVLGYEVCVRAGTAIKPGVREHGVHAPGMIGPLGAAAAVGKLLELPGPQVGAAMAIAGSLLPVAPFESFVEGASGKDLYGGWAGFLGTTAAQLASQGMDGPHRFLEGKRSMGKLLLHGNCVAASDLLGDLGTAYAIEQVYFKPFAAARSVQPAVTGVLGLAAEHHLAPDMIEAIEVETYPFSAGLSDDVTVTTPVSARLSIPYAVAAALCTGRLGPEVFLPEALHDEATLALAKKVKVVSAASHGTGPTGARSSTVSIRLRGRMADVPACTLVAEMVRSRWDQHAPPSDAELEAKFSELAGMALPPRRVQELASTIWELERLGDASSLVQFMFGVEDGAD